MTFASSTQHILLAIGIMGLISFVTRALPFAFSRMLEKIEAVRVIGTYLPGCIMLLLVMHTLHEVRWKVFPFGIPELLAIFFVWFIHKWKRIAIVSILMGTLSYILMRSYLGY